MQGSQHHHSHASLKNESVWFKTKLISQFLTLSFLISQPLYLSYLHAAPIGGEVVGGTGSISQTELTTTINQTSQNLAVDWQSFDVQTNEQVNFVQPNTSSIALNRILGNNGSTIQGQINANGQVILVNPNGVFFTSTATINVGGIIASSLDMTPADFMNGNYIFNEVLGHDGAVVNSGIINASVGGNVALIGKQVKNDGLISANLGSVVLAAGKQSILTFDNQGLIGVQVTKEILQEELGLEEAVVNSGEINAAGGRVLLTASASHDVFSQAVNSGSLNQATSVVVNADGSFTLGGGADVLNTGSIDVSSETNSQNTARIILLGENVTSSGSIKADTQNGNAGEIEIHANNKTLLTQNSITSAQALTTGNGGLIKVLGDKVGLFDNAQVNASGANGGGEVLIGGDRQGLNSLIRNANFIYLGADTVVKADATDSGNGGKIITFANDTARLYGNLYARGGAISGNGGFIETSGKRGFYITKTPDITAVNGNAGHWLIDPNDITIVSNATGTSGIDPSGTSPDTAFDSTDNTNATLAVGLILNALDGNNTTVTITTSNPSPSNTTDGNITFDVNLDYDGKGNDTLVLNAANNIDTSTRDIIDGNTNSGADKLNLIFNADADNNGSGDVILDDSSIFTNGGTFTATGQNFTSSRGGGGGGTHYLDTRDKSSLIKVKGGDVNIYMLGDVDIGAEIFTGGGTVNIGDMRVAGSEIRPTSFINRNNGVIDTTGEDNIDGGAIIINVDNTVVEDGKITVNQDLISDGGQAVTSTVGVDGKNAGVITLNSTGNISITANIDSNGSNGKKFGGLAEVKGWDGGNGNSVTITSSAGDVSLTREISAKGGDGDGDTDTGSGADPANGGSGGAISIIAQLGSITTDKLTSAGGAGIGGAKFPGVTPNTFANGGDAGEIKLIATTAGKTIQLNDNIDASGGSFDDGGNANPGHIGFGADVTFTGDVVLGANITIDSSGYTIFPTAVTTGDVWFKNTITALTDRNRNLTINANDVNFDDNVGSATFRLGDLSIAATGDVNASTNSLNLKSLNVLASNSYTSGLIDSKGFNTEADGGSVTVNSATTANIGSIDTRGGNRTSNGTGRKGGNVQVNAASITVGKITTSGGNAFGTNSNGGSAGTISLTGTENSSNVSSITLNDDIIATGGENTTSGVLDGTFVTGQIASLILNGLAADTGNAVINYTASFTSSVDITGNTGNDTLNGAAVATSNTWNITGADDGDLNTTTTSQVTFNNIENLTGNTTQDDFVFNGGTLSGDIDGGVNSSSIVFNSITGDAVSNVWTIDTADDSGTVTRLSGRFSNIGNLTGNIGRDDFTITGDVALTGSINGVGGSAGGNTTDDPLKNSLTINTASDNTWAISSEDSGTVTSGVAGTFSNIQKVKGGSGDDTFNVGLNGSLDLIEGGSDNSTAPTTPTLGDIVNFTALTTGVDVTLGTTLTISQTDFNVDSVEQINANSSATQNNLTGKDQDNTWNITKTNGGNVEGTVNFSDFTHLNGGSANDLFFIDVNGSLTGAIDGKGQTNTSGDVLDLSARTGITLALDTNSISYDAAVPISYSNIETIKGNNSSTINGANVVTDITWNITGQDDGNVIANSITTLFENFGNLIGGTGNDAFLFTSTGLITGLVDGTSGTNDYVSMTTADSNSVAAFTLSSTPDNNATNIVNIDNVTGDYVNNTTPAYVELIGYDSTNTWNISSLNDGSVTDTLASTAVTFTNVANLTGGSLDDTFTYAATGSTTGLIDGGSAGNDKVDMAAVSGNITVGIGTDIIRIDNVVGNNKTTDSNNPLATPVATLGGATFESNWTVTGLNSGNVVYNDGINPDYTVNFSGFNKLQGRDNVVDSFALAKTGTVEGNITGSIDGGAGVDASSAPIIDTIDYSAITDKVVNVGDATSGITNIEQVRGDGSTTILKGVLSEQNIWTLSSGTNSGRVDYIDITNGNSSENLLFIDINKLRAGDQSDTFILNGGSLSAGASITGGAGDDLVTLTNGSSFTGEIVSGGGTNTYDINTGTQFDGTITGASGAATSETVNLTLSGTQTGSLIFNGNSTATNTLNIDGDSDAGSGGKNYSGIYSSDIDSLRSDNLVYTNAANSNGYTIQYSNIDTIQDDLIANTLTVNGTQYNDVITLGANSFQVSHAAFPFPFVAANDATTVNYTNKDNLIVDGLSGASDEIKITSPLDFGTTGILELNAETLTLPDTASYTGALITAAELKLNSVNTVAAAINAQPNTIQTDVASLSIVNSGIININEVDGVDISTLSTSNDVDITSNAAGDITSSSVLVSSGVLKLTALDGDINLLTDNQLTGALSFTTSVNNDVSIVNTLATKINNISTRNLNINTTGANADIHQTTTGTLTSSGLSTLNSTGNITLTNATNDFNQVAGISLKNFNVQDSNSIGLNFISAVETKIVSGGDILDTNNNGINITGTKATLIANTGIGFNGSTNAVNALETNVSEIDATTTSGQINIDNIGGVKLTNLVVTNAGNINFNNTGDVEINKVNAGYGTRSPLAAGGNFNMIVTSGSVTGTSRNDYRSSAHITAFNTDILVPSGTFGSAGQPVSIKVNNEFKLFSLQSAVFKIGNPLIDNDSSTAKIAITDAFSNLAGQQLIEIESIGDVDPAIFTDVRNYSHSDIALMMPADQRFDISDDEEEEKRQNKLLQKTP